MKVLITAKKLHSIRGVLAGEVDLPEEWAKKLIQQNKATEVKVKKTKKTPTK